jgi:hypothetical protein
LPQELYHYYKQLRFDLQKPGFKFSHTNLFGVDVTSGVDEVRIHKNLFALHHILHSFSSKQVVYERKEYDDDFWFLAYIVSKYSPKKRGGRGAKLRGSHKEGKILAVYYDSFKILAWFWAMGISVTDVEQWLNLGSEAGPIEVAEVLSDYEDKIRESMQGQSEFKKITTIPLPHLVDVKVRLSSRALHLMRNSDEDKSFTQHVCPFPCFPIQYKYNIVYSTSPAFFCRSVVTKRNYTNNFLMTTPMFPNTVASSLALFWHDELKHNSLHLTACSKSMSLPITTISWKSHKLTLSLTYANHLLPS